MKTKIVYYTARVVFTIGILIWIIVCTQSCLSGCCRHGEWRKEYSFNSRGDTSPGIGWVKEFCKDCGYYKGISYLYGEPTDSSYLDLISESCGGVELVDGEYYTISAIVNNNIPDRISCRVENEDIKVHFSAKFKDEYKDVIESIDSGDEITFRGKFVEIGYDWTDCELISE